MRRRWIVFGGAGVAVLLVAGAAIFYFAALPGILVDDYRDRARPEHRKVETAMGRVYRTFSAKTFGVSSRDIDKAKTPDQYVRALHRAVARERRQLKPPRAAARHARNVLRGVDREALLEVADPPALHGAGKLPSARRVASAERRYLAASKGFLDEYERLVEYDLAVLNFSDRFGTTLGRGLAALPKHPQTPEAYARPLDAFAKKVERVADGFHAKPPNATDRRSQRAGLGAARFYARKLHGLADAVRARDLAKVNSFDREITTGLKKFRTGGRRELQRLLGHSRYSRSIRKLNGLEMRIATAYRELL
ncbi:MAG TPA: hypothetical protein VF545_11565 [Thermoleophilaceae bacterium]|jgi:hypothetical protein